MTAGAAQRRAGRHKFRSALGVALAVFALDRTTKAVVSSRLDLRDAVPVIDGFLNIVHARNPGAAFSFLADAPAWFRGPFFVCVTVGAIIAVLYVVARLPPQDRLMRAALGGVLGGALGNLFDRLAYGEVVDFIDVYWRTHHWPAFNVADSSITVAVVAILAHTLLSEPPDASAAHPRGAPRP
ncbi:MAG: signal peptidase II [Deltaproteobacteria bacterium]|nr:signal peptidase II [Deltaproteobacteria bacterium]